MTGTLRSVVPFLEISRSMLLSRHNNPLDMKSLAEEPLNMLHHVQQKPSLGVKNAF